jgi:hypothetical protein
MDRDRVALFTDWCRDTSYREEIPVAWKRHESAKIVLFVGELACCGVFGGCSTLDGQSLATTSVPLKIAVGPVILEAPITASTQIHSFEKDPPPELEPILLAQLKDEIQIKAQRFLTEHLAKQPGLTVVPFQETRRMLADIGDPEKPMTEDQIRALGQTTGADVVVTGLIHDYGRVRWQYWVTGWLLHVSIWTTVVGAATSWNPAAVGAYLAVDATTDLPIWYGGAKIFGWVFRPVRVHLDAIQLTNCEGPIWSDDELRVRVPGKALAQYPPEQHKQKEVQLEANLNRAMAEIAEAAGEKLALQVCNGDGRPEKIRGFSFSSVFDLLL